MQLVTNKIFKLTLVITITFLCCLVLNSTAYAGYEYGTPGCSGNNALKPVENVSDNAVSDNAITTQTVSTTPVVTGQVAPLNRIYDTPEQNFIYNYYNDSVFIGDSIMLGFRNYSASRTDSYLYNVKFLAAGSYSLNNALRPVTPDSLHPIYMGEKRQIWDSIALMGVKHVFIMFGTNDIGCVGVDKSLENYVTVVNNIKALCPDVDIHIISMTYTLAGAGRGGLNNVNVDLFNAGVMQLCSAYGWTYHDLCTPMSDGTGNLNPAYCSDGYVHVNFSGYSLVWEPLFAQYAYSIYQ